MDESGEGSESEQQVLKGLIAFVLLTCRNSLKVRGKEEERRVIDNPYSMFE